LKFPRPQQNLETLTAGVHPVGSMQAKADIIAIPDQPERHRRPAGWVGPDRVIGRNCPACGRVDSDSPDLLV